MHDWQHILERHEETEGPGSDFEARVFAKIRRKKQQRKVGIGAAAAFATMTLLALVVLRVDRAAPARGQLPAAEKAEVPVSEELFFSTSDSRTRYTLQPVALDNGGDAPQASLNQI